MSTLHHAEKHQKYTEKDLQDSKAFSKRKRNEIRKEELNSRQD